MIVLGSFLKRFHFHTGLDGSGEKCDLKKKILGNGEYSPIFLMFQAILTLHSLEVEVARTCFVCLTQCLFVKESEYTAHTVCLPQAPCFTCTGQFHTFVRERTEVWVPGQGLWAAPKYGACLHLSCAISLWVQNTSRKGLVTAPSADGSPWTPAFSRWQSLSGCCHHWKKHWLKGCDSFLTVVIAVSTVGTESSGKPLPPAPW